MLHRKFGAEKTALIDVVCTRQDMVACAGTTCEIFFRTLNDLKADGLIRQANESLSMLDAAKVTTLNHTKP